MTTQAVSTYADQVQEALKLDFEAVHRLTVELDLASTAVEYVEVDDNPRSIASSARMSEALKVAQRALQSALIIVNVYGGVEAANVRCHPEISDQIATARKLAAEALVDETNPDNDCGAQG